MSEHATIPRRVREAARLKRGARIHFTVLPDGTILARSRLGTALASGDDVLISLPVVVETEWVLRSRYGMRRDVALPVLRSALEAREPRFEDESAIEEALHEWSDSPCGFADADQDVRRH